MKKYLTEREMHKDFLLKDGDYKSTKEILERIIKNGSEQDYLRNLNDPLTGKEENGYLYQDNTWYLFNVKTNSYEKIEEKKKVKKV